MTHELSTLRSATWLSHLETMSSIMLATGPPGRRDRKRRVRSRFGRLPRKRNVSAACRGNGTGAYGGRRDGGHQPFGDRPGERMPFYDVPIWAMDDGPFPASGFAAAGWKLTAPEVPPESGAPHLTKHFRRTRKKYSKYSLTQISDGRGTVRIAPQLVLEAPSRIAAQRAFSLLQAALAEMDGNAAFEIEDAIVVPSDRRKLEDLNEYDVIAASSAIMARRSVLFASRLAAKLSRSAPLQYAVFKLQLSYRIASAHYAEVSPTYYRKRFGRVAGADRPRRHGLRRDARVFGHRGDAVGAASAGQQAGQEGWRVGRRSLSRPARTPRPCRRAQCRAGELERARYADPRAQGGAGAEGRTHVVDEGPSPRPWGFGRGCVARGELAAQQVHDPQVREGHDVDLDVRCLQRAVADAAPPAGTDRNLGRHPKHAGTAACATAILDLFSSSSSVIRYALISDRKIEL